MRVAPQDQNDFGLGMSYPIQVDNLILPEVVVEDFSTSTGKILKSSFDLVWNAWGYSGSRNFDDEGNWIARV